MTYIRRYSFTHRDPLVTSEINKSYDAGYQHGADDYEARLKAAIEPHLTVCNFRAVTAEDCDVCHWVRTTLEVMSR